MSAPALIGLGILVGLAVGGLLVWFWVARKAARLEGELNIERALSEERVRAFKLQLEQVEANKSALKIEFENLSRDLLAARGKELVETNSNSLNAILKPLSEKIDGFQHRVNQVHSDMIQNSASLIQQIKQLETVGLTMSADAQHLTDALKGDKKLVGNWGETQLERTLELAGLRAGEHYDSQASFKDEAGKRYLPDFVIRLPEGKNLVVDSKVSLVDYEAAVAADAEPLRDAALKRHGEAVKAHIDNLASKAYQQLPGLSSPDFVMMFMPVEPAYIEVMRNHRDLFAYGYQKGVVMVSHSTLMPILRTVANLWMVERSNEEAREISARAGEIFNSVSLVAERLASLGGSLQTASKKYNETVTALIGRQGLQGKVERFQSLSAKATRPFPKELRPIITENDRLQLSDSKGEEST
ncbi:MAG: DNA recombination protein RmuC, partial [Halieaceae bacterium]